MTEPTWIAVLRQECKRSSQAAAARVLGISASTVNSILKGHYKASTGRIQQRVEGALMGATVDCPVLGELARDRCMEFQSRKFAATNAVRVQLFRACKTCKHRRKS